MRNLIFILLIFPSILFAQKTQTSYYHLKLKEAEGKVDEKNHRTGEWKFWDHKGNLVAIRQYKNDQLDGICLYEKYDWEPTEPQLSLMISNKSLYDKAIKRQKVSKLDTIIEKAEYHKNQLHGTKYTYDANGNPVSEIPYYENKKNGAQKNYNYKTGKLSEIVYYNYDYMDSLVGFDKEGNIIKRVVNSKKYIRKVEYDNGMMVRKEEHFYYENGESTTVTCTYENNTKIKCDSTWVRNDNKKFVSKEEPTHKIEIPIDVKDDYIRDPMDDPNYIGTPCGDYDDLGNCRRHNHKNDSKNQNEINEFPDKEAKYPGGTEAMMKFLTENYKLPQTDIAPANTKIYIRFIVEKDGSLSELEVLRGAGELYDQEAKRVIRSMPKWEPAELKGKIVRSRYVVPIHLEVR